MTPRARCLALLLAAAPLAASATLYRWVDAGGAVHYGDTPPADARQVRPLDASRSTLSVVPGLSPDELARMQARVDQARGERLERELAELRARPPAPPVVVLPPEPVAYPVIVAPRHPRPLPRPHLPRVKDEPAAPPAPVFSVRTR